MEISRLGGRDWDSNENYLFPCTRKIDNFFRNQEFKEVCAVYTICIPHNLVSILVPNITIIKINIILNLATKSFSIIAFINFSLIPILSNPIPRPRLKQNPRKIDERERKRGGSDSSSPSTIQIRGKSNDKLLPAISPPPRNFVGFDQIVCSIIPVGYVCRISTFKRVTGTGGMEREKGQKLEQNVQLVDLGFSSSDRKGRRGQ